MSSEPVTTGARGSQVGLLLMLGMGAFLVSVSVEDAREAVRRAPVPVGCAEFVAAPRKAGRWVEVSGCRLDVSSAATRRWKGWMRRSDAGVSSGRTLEIFLPVAPLGTPLGTPSTVVVSTRDVQLLSLLDRLSGLDEAAADAFIAEHTAELEAALAPEKLTGYVEPVASWSSRSALRALEAAEAVVLVQGGRPLAANAFIGLGAGLGLWVWALLPLARRLVLGRSQP